MGNKGLLNPQTIMKLVRIGALAAPAASIAMNPAISGQGKILNIMRMYTGIDWQAGYQFNWRHLLTGWLPYIAANVVTHGIPKLVGMIRRL